MLRRTSVAMIVLVAVMLAADAAAPPAQPQFPASSIGGFWIEGPDDTILMAHHDSIGSPQVVESADLGLTWRGVAALPNVGPMTRLADGSLLMVAPAPKIGLAWVRSVDHGRSWSDPTPIPIEFRNRVYSWGPIVETSDGRWAYCPYAQNGNLDADALIVWSSDRGVTWGKPIAFPTPVDGNKGLTEVALVELGPNDLLAAIRSDDVENGGFDGFYFSRSKDGVNWSTPEPVGDMGRQPHFFRLADCWALTYRQWIPSRRTNFSAVRFSHDGLKWSRPYRIQEGVQDGACLVQVRGQVIAFNQRYPQAKERTRLVIRVPNSGDWFESSTSKDIRQVALRADR